jgi:iron complex transport system permease protein
MKPNPTQQDYTAQRASQLGRARIVLASLALLLVIFFLRSMILGSIWIPIERVISIFLSESTGAETVIVLDVRLPQALTAILAGAALGIAGLQMQTLFRNPLADPFALGIASGASLGVALVLLASGSAAYGVLSSSLGLFGDAMVTAASIAGAAAALSVVLSLSTRVENPATVLILGLMIGYAASAFVMVLVAGADPAKLQRWIAWGFGSFAGVTWQRLTIFAPLIVSGLAIAAATTKQLNALLLGETYARSLGMNVEKMRIITMAGASILGGVVTAFCGPIAFLGVAIPHLCRVMLGTSDHRMLVPATMLMGGIVALAAQLISLSPGSAGVLPLNAVTALLGAPVVIVVLMRSRSGAFVG